MSMEVLGFDAYGFRLAVPENTDMKDLGARVASYFQGGDVVLLSGPLGAGKTTLAQGIGEGLHLDGPVVSPTFTIARELHGHLGDGQLVTLVHVDAYRLGGKEYEPGEDTAGPLLDELESLGLDEELEEPGRDTVVLMEWGDQMVSVLAEQRLEIFISRPQVDMTDVNEPPTSAGERIVSLHGVGSSWVSRLKILRKVVQE